MSAKESSTQTVERVLSSVAVILCLGACFWARHHFSAMPALTSAYLVEAVVLSIVCGACIWKSGHSGESFFVMLAWTTIGMLTGFTVMGLWSIGAPFVPVNLLLIVAAAIAGHRGNTSIFPNLTACALAMMAQAGLMVLVIRLVSGNHSS